MSPITVPKTPIRSFFSSLLDDPRGRTREAGDSIHNLKETRRSAENILINSR
jgi:hypothetical protein